MFRGSEFVHLGGIETLSREDWDTKRRRQRERSLNEGFGGGWKTHLSTWNNSPPSSFLPFSRSFPLDVPRSRSVPVFLTPAMELLACSGLLCPLALFFFEELQKSKKRKKFLSSLGLLSLSLTRQFARALSNSLYLAILSRMIAKEPCLARSAHYAEEVV